MSERHLVSALKKLIGIIEMSRERTDKAKQFFPWHKAEGQKKAPRNISEWKLEAKSLPPSTVLQEEKASAMIG